MSTATTPPPVDARRATYAELVRGLAGAHPRAVALVLPDEEVTYRDLLERAEMCARELRTLGIGRGDTFGILLPNGSRLVELLIGGALIGAVAVPINTRFKPAEVEHVCRDGRLRAIFTTDAIDEVVDFKAILLEALPGLAEAPDPTRLALVGFEHLIAVVTDQPAPGMVDRAMLAELAAGRPAPTVAEGPAADDPLLIMYTSGTTAHPKGCVTRNRSLVDNASAIAERFAIPAGDRWWDPLPMFHMGAILLMSAVFTRGGMFISTPHFDPDEAFDMFARHRPTVLYPLFPTITLTLMHHERFASCSLDDVRVIANVSPPDIQRRVQDAFPSAMLISAYGMTELCGTLAYSKLDDTLEQRTTTCGHLLPGWQAMIIDPDSGDPVPPDTRGELVARGPNLFGGYFHDRAQTEASIDGDGWFHTGDQCSMDANGLLSFHGRLKDVLKVGGENVSALEVESFLATHPAIKLAQVIGIPDERLIEVPAAFVELAPGATLTAEEVLAHCDGRIARFKTPRHVRFVTDWPMSSTKVQKFRLRDQLLAELNG